MKKLVFLALIVLGSVATAQAQDVSLKFGWTYAFDSDEAGINLGAKYGVTPEIDLAAGLSFYFPGRDYNLWMFDIDGHYNFPMGGGLTLYPLAGFNFTTAGWDNHSGLEEYNHTEFGVNIGGGAQFQIVDQIGAFAELKYILGDYDQGVFGLGVTYTF